MKGAAQVDGDDGIPFFYRKVLDSGHMLYAGVVNQNVHRTKLRGGKLHHVFNFGGFAHVGAVVSHFDTQRRDFSLGTLGIAKPVQYDVGTLGRERFGDAQANTAG